MDVEAMRAFALTLPHVAETMQWGETLVFWVGDKAIGGKMFAAASLDKDRKTVMSFSAGPERFNELLEFEGVIPAPYVARIHWVALERWDAIPPAELRRLLTHAHELTYAKLPRRTRDVLSMSPEEYLRAVAARRKVLSSRTQAAGTKLPKKDAKKKSR